MKTAKVMESPATSATEQGMPLPDAAQRQLDALRAAIESRLTELESALADPERTATLPGLIIELSRLATSEAQAAATRACLQIKHDSDATRLEQEARSSVAIETERRAVAELRRSLDQAQKRLDTVETEKHAAVEAARDQARQIESEREARLELDRTVAALERQVEESRTTLADRQEALRTAESAQAEAATRADDAERRLADLQQRLTREEQSNRELTIERVRSGDRIAELELTLEALQARHDSLEKTQAEERATARAYAVELERQLVDIRQQVAGAQDEAVRAREELLAAQESASRVTGDSQALHEQIERLERALAEAEQQVATGRAESHAHETARESAAAEATALTQLLDEAQAQHRQLQAAFDARSRDLVEAMAQAERDADGRSERERALADQIAAVEKADAQLGDLQRQLAERSRDLAEERRALVDLEKQLASERAISTDLRAAVSDAHSAVDGDQETLSLLKQAASDAEVRLADLRSDKASLQAAHDALARELESARDRANDTQRAHADLLAAHEALRSAQDEWRRQGAELHEALEQERRRATEGLEQADQAARERDALRIELTQLQGAHAAAESALTGVRGEAESNHDAVHADLATLRERLAAVESARARSEEVALELGERAAVIERERDALSLALDTERMMRTEVPAAPPITDEPAPAPVSADEDTDEGELLELTFDEDLAPADDVVRLADPQGWDNVRLCTRYSFTSRVDVKVNGTSAILVDLSVGGCGVRTTLTLAPGEVVRVGLPGDLTPLLCLGKVIWTRPEAAVDKLPAGHRVGIKFTQSDEAALEAFIIMRADL